MEDQNGKMGGGVAISQLDANFEGSTLLGVHVCLKMLLKYYFFPSVPVSRLTYQLVQLTVQSL